MIRPTLTIQAVLSVAFASLLIGCQPYRIEHMTRSDFYNRASSEPLPDEITLPDGTIVKYESPTRPPSFDAEGNDSGKPFSIREEDEKGNITLHDYLPEHVLANALACVRNEEYRLLYDQLLAQETREKYESIPDGYKEFELFFRTNRRPIAAALNRMILGIPTQQTRIEQAANGAARCSIRPQVAGGMKFTVVDIVKEGTQLKLLLIQ